MRRFTDNGRMSTPEPEPERDPEWIPLDENPHADDKRDVLDPTHEGEPFKRLIVIALGIGMLVAFVVLVLLVV